MNLSKCPYCNQLCTNNATHICKQDVHLPYERSAYEVSLQISSEVPGDFREFSYLSDELSHVTEIFSPDNTNAHRDFSSEAGVPQDQSLLCTNPNNMNDRSTVEEPSFQPAFSKWGDKNTSQEIPLVSHTNCFQTTNLNEKNSFIYRQYYSTSESMEASGIIHLAQILEKHSDPSKKQQLPRNNSFVQQQQTEIEAVDNTNGAAMDCVSIPKHISENPLDPLFEFRAPANLIQNERFCPDCSGIFGIKYELNENSATLNKCMSYICELCRKEFIPPNPLKDGVFASTQDDCLAVAGPSVSQPLNTPKSQKSVDARAFVNSLCSANHKSTSLESGEQFSTDVNLKELSVKHLEAKPFFCKICDRSFTDEPHLNNHKLLHTGKEPFKCNLCEKEILKKQSFKQHSFKHHRFNCVTCNRRFLNAHSLILHKLTHTGKENLTCEICGRLFFATSNLNIHLRRFYKIIFFEET